MYIKDTKLFCTEIQKKILNLIQKSDVYLNHAPEYEKKALCSHIRSLQYSLDISFIEVKHTKKVLRTLHKAHIRLEQLKHLWRVFFTLGYFNYHNGKEDADEVRAARRAAVISDAILEIGSMLGGFVKATKQGQGYSQNRNVVLASGNYDNRANAGV